MACGRTKNTGREIETGILPSALPLTTTVTLSRLPHIPRPPVPHLQNEVLASEIFHQKKYVAKSQCTKQITAECSDGRGAEGPGA